MVSLRKLQVEFGLLILMLGLLFAVPQSVAALTVDVHISGESKEIVPGDRLYFEVAIQYPENTTRKDLPIEYTITEDGELIASAKVLRAVETNASFLEYIVIPEEVVGGTSLLTVAVDGVVRNEASATFTVAKSFDQIRLYFFILLGIICFVILLVIIQLRSMVHKQI